MKKEIITLMCATALLSSCHIYKSYDRPEDITVEGLYRDTVAGGDTLAADTANQQSRLAQCGTDRKTGSGCIDVRTFGLCSDAVSLSARNGQQLG